MTGTAAAAGLSSASPAPVQRLDFRAQRHLRHPHRRTRVRHHGVLRTSCWRIFCCIDGSALVQCFFHHQNALTLDSAAERTSTRSRAATSPELDTSGLTNYYLTVTDSSITFCGAHLYSNRASFSRGLPSALRRECQIRLLLNHARSSLTPFAHSTIQLRSTSETPSLTFTSARFEFRKIFLSP